MDGFCGGAIDRQEQALWVGRGVAVAEHYTLYYKTHSAVFEN